ncbi:unnamed protein product [Owenia fusiformis]|uniref:WD repeat-containing protein 90 n=1 Tax=Owenia fusiformis TaxID=6347 RepID=A0A8J1XXD3_OWEFU|nr:unnamed protein product [Owenia fusiformis]
MSHLWQHPYVNVFKHFEIGSWKKSSKEGEVVTVMDRTIKCTVYKITGSIPASNYIQLPTTLSQSLGLTGHYLYLMFKPIPGKYFVVHLDVATADNLIVRISFSNLFKEFKSTSTWLQFPFIVSASKGSVHAQAAVGAKDISGPAPLSTRWTILCLDFQYILSMYLNRKYSYIKSVKLCANMLVKNMFTSDSEYEPGMKLDEVKKLGLNLHGISPMPREMAFLLPKTEKWHDHYDLIRFPTDASKKPFDSIQQGRVRDKSPPRTKNGPPGTISPKRIDVKHVDTSRHNALEGTSRINTLTSRPKSMMKRSVTSQLPQVGIDGDQSSVAMDNTGEVHVFAHPEGKIMVHRKDKHKAKTSTTVINKESLHKSLQPDPILQLRRIVGFGGASTKDALWTNSGRSIVYPCHAVVVTMQIANGAQRFFIGHTDKVSCISLNGSSDRLASGQTGTQSVVRVWDFESTQCLAMFKTHSHSINCLSFSHSGNVLCGVGKDSHSKNMVVMWNTSCVHKGGEVTVMAKAHTEVDILRMRIATFDDTRMVSCGRDNIRIWRVKEGSLRSAPVNLQEYHSMEFTDCCFEAGYQPSREPNDRLIYVCSRSGHIFEINYRKVAIHHVRRLLPVDKRHRNKREKQTFNSSKGISINSMCVNEAFCVTGSDDGFLRLWPLDFAHVYLEAEHEGPVSATGMTQDGLHILAGTTTGNLGVLDVTTRGYTTLMRSHTDKVVSVAIDSIRRHIATISKDHTIRVWDLDNQQQLYDFTAPEECPSNITYQPHQQVFACGFQSGCVRVFNVASTSMLAEHKQHRGCVIGLVYSPNGDYLYSAGSLGSIALYDATETGYPLLRLLGNTHARGEIFGPDALAVSPDGRQVAFVGPSEFTVSVVNSKTLDEMLRIDITSLNTTDDTQNAIDTAERVAYTSANVKHLLVTTSSNKLLKLDARSGRLLTEIEHIHRASCTSLSITEDGRHLATTGDKVIKIWDYHMRLDLNFQVFIGHSEAIHKVIFTPDGLGLISVGEAIFLWDFLANTHQRQQEQPEGRTPLKNYIPRVEENEERMSSHSRLKMSPSKSVTFDDRTIGRTRSPVRRSLSTELGEMPRRSPPRPTSYQPPGKIADISSIHLDAEESESEEEVLLGPTLQEDNSQEDSDSDMNKIEITGKDSLGHSPSRQQHQRYQTPTKQLAPAFGSSRKNKPDIEQLMRPCVRKHFIKRPKAAAIAQRRYTAPPNQTALRLNSIVGYNGNGRNNMVWNAETGFFAYTSGSVVIVEDLNTSSQHHLIGHVEEISTITLQNDCQVLASASGAQGLTTPQICLWDLHTLTCSTTLTHHEHDVICLAYSRDDRFLISIGDYRECSVVVWSTQNHQVLITSKTALPVHHVAWDPHTCNEFVTVGTNGTVLFWLVDETGDAPCLNLHEAEVPEEILQTNHMVTGQVDFTSAEFAGDSTLYIGANNGIISAWDTRQNKCFMHWEAGSTEIDIVISRHGRLVTGSVGGHLKLWSVVGIGEMRLPGGGNDAIRQGGLTMEDEMMLDGDVTTAMFDETMDMGIVGTSSGTLWYINWTERTSIRLVSGHSQKVNGVAMCTAPYMATCCDDGSLRVWGLKEREQTLQFQVIDQACTCVVFAPEPTRQTPSSATPVGMTAAVSEYDDFTKLPSVAGGYSDGTLRMFDLNKVEMSLKMHPHAVSVTTIQFSADGRMLLSGDCDGLICISSPTTGMTVRIINDHKGAPITNIDVTFTQDQDLEVHAPLLWLATSADRRVSVWSADWSKDFCELVDWLTFAAPGFTPDGSVIKKGDQSQYRSLPPSIARFSPEEQDVIVYMGYGMAKQVQFYSLSQRQVIRTLPVTHWPVCMDLSPKAAVIALGISERLLKLQDYYEGSFQDYIGHSDKVENLKFSPDGKTLVTISHSEIIIWDVHI